MPVCTEVKHSDLLPSPSPPEAKSTALAYVQGYPPWTPVRVLMIATIGCVKLCRLGKPDPKAPMRQAALEIVGAGVDDVPINLQRATQCIASRPRVAAARSSPKFLALRCASKTQELIGRSESRGKPFSALGELLCYLAESDTVEFIKAYLPNTMPSMASCKVRMGAAAVQNARQHRSSQQCHWAPATDTRLQASREPAFPMLRI